MSEILAPRPILVYLVDDDADHLRLIRRALAAQDAQFAFRAFTSPGDALRSLAAEPPDVVVSDYMFSPGDPTGIEFYRQAVAAGCGAPFIFLTGQGNEEVAAEAFRRGASDYFTKDIGFAHFIRIAQAIHRSVAHRRMELEKNSLEGKFSAMEFLCQRLMEEAADLILLVDEQGHLVSVNRRVASESGYSPEEMVGRPLTEFIVAEGREEVAQHIARLVSGGPAVRVQAAYLKKDGERRLMEATAAAATTHPGERQILIIARDITDWSRREADLVWTRQLLDQVINALDEVIHVVDPGLKVLYCNRSIESLSRGRVTGLGMLGRNLVEVFPFLVEQGVVEEYRRVFATGEPLVTRESTRYENQNIVTRACKLPIRGEDGRVDKVITIMRDVTREAFMDEELSRKNRELESLNQELSSFISMTSHELRSPLTNIEGFSHLLEDKFDSLATADLRDFISRIASNATRLHLLIDDLLLFVRERKRAAEPAAVDLKSLLNEVLAQLGGLVQSSGADISLDLGAAEAWADRQKLHQVLKNLLENALTYRRVDEQPRISVAVHPREERLFFSVSDNGPGIQDQEREVVFEIFRRGSSSRGKQGTGVGLALVRENVERMGGMVRLESSGPAGSVFSFSLPSRP